MNEETLFHLALDTPADARQALLDELCGGDAVLRQRLLALLDAHENPRSFLTRPAPALCGRGTSFEPGDETPAGPGLAVRPGSAVGPYLLLQRIGEGGMGSVWKAEQTHPVRRVVALKLIKLGMDTKQVIARFEAERQALALMDHPNIARVFDAGETDAGRPYFVMELVNGVPVTRYCDENRLGLKERLELFVSVCQAVQHAHQKGVVHRDLKPGNVLVARYDDRPVVKIIDFGVAKATGPTLNGPTLFTEFGAIIGTLEYMAPEQAELNQADVDARSDVYSLGVLLYELLTGTTPFERRRVQAAGLLEVLRILREEDPPPPSTRLSAAREPAGEPPHGLAGRRLAGVVRGELDWIVMKALEKDRDRRYRTACGLGEDVRRYLNDEPVRAGPPTAGYRLRKLVRRHRRLLATAAALGLGVLVAAGSVGWVVRDRAARLAMTEREVSGALRDVAQFYQEGKVAEAIASASRAEALLLAGDASETTRLRVREWRANLDLATRLEDIRVEQTGRREAGFDVGQIDDAYRRALAPFDVETGDPDLAAARIAESPVREPLVTALLTWAWEKIDRRLAGWERLVEVARRADPDPTRDRYLAAFLKGDHEALLRIARDKPVAELPPATVLLLAQALSRTGQRDLACEMCQRAQKRNPGDAWLNLEIATLLATRLQVGPQHADAAGYLRAFLAARPRSATAHVSFGYRMAQLGRSADADDAFAQAVRLEPNSSEIYRQLGDARIGQRRFREAEEAYRLAIAKASAQQSNLCMLNYNLSQALMAQGRLAEAEVPLREALRIRPEVPVAWTQLAQLLERLGKLPEAADAYRQAIKVSPDHAAAHCNLGLLLQRMGDFPAGLASLRRGDELARARKDWKAPTAEWVKVAERAVELDRKLVGIVWGEASPGPLEDRLALADVCLKRRLYAASARFFEEAMATDPKLTDPRPGHRYNAACAAALAGCGQGGDAATLSPEGRAALRARSLAWLRDDLEAWRALLGQHPQPVAQTMRHWLGDADFNGVRGDKALAALPEAERQGWGQLWQEVGAVLDTANRAAGK